MTSSAITNQHHLLLKPKVLRVLLICGIIGPLLYASTDILLGLLWESYSFISQPISAESAVGAPTRGLGTVPGLTYLVLVIAFGLGVLMVAGKRRALRIIGVLQLTIGIVRFLWSPFPMHLGERQSSFANTMHNSFAAIQVLQLLTCIGLGTIALSGKRFRYYSLATITALLSGGVLTFMAAGQLVPQQVGNWVGLLERISVYGSMLWVLVLAVVLFREELQPTQPTETTRKETM